MASRWNGDRSTRTNIHKKKNYCGGTSCSSSAVCLLAHEVLAAESFLVMTGVLGNTRNDHRHESEFMELMGMVGVIEICVCVCIVHGVLSISGRVHAEQTLL